MPRKTFKAAEPQHSPAESYISGEQPKELKTRRAQFVLKPSIVTDLKKIAVITRRSMNETVCDISEEYIKEHQAEVQKYNDTFGEDV